MISREQIIAWARQAGFKVNWQHADVAEIKAQRYERFAALIEQATIERCAIERIAGRPPCTIRVMSVTAPPPFAH